MLSRLFHQRRCRRRPPPSLFTAALLILATTYAIGDIRPCVASTPPSPAVIRVRKADGSVLRIPLPDEDGDDDATLSSVLSAAGVDVEANDGQGGVLKCRLGVPGRGVATDLVPSGEDGRRTVAELGLRHGSMVTVLPFPPAKAKTDDEGKKTKKDSDGGDGNDRYDPFPDLAKSTSYSAASSRARALARGATRGMSYGDMSKVQSSMHNVEPQPTGPLTRVYVCRVGAAKFQSHCIVKEKKKEQPKTSIKDRKKAQDQQPEVDNRAALLFGTVNTERMDQKRNVPRTSLSTPRSDQKMCEVGKVHAVWEPPGQRSGKPYDESCLSSSPAVDRAVRVAGWLGLRPLGWMFSYDDDRHGGDGGEGALPVHGRDAVVGSRLQIEAMKRADREEGRKFVTLALDGRTGATEAFQISDVCVQMVAEGALTIPKKAAAENTRFMNLEDPVVVSGDETKKLDSVLLLVNTAMLSHVGSFSGGESAPPGGNVKKASGLLLAKTKKRILSCLSKEEGEGKNGEKIIEELCDFDVLVALDALIGKEDSEKLCKVVRKYARGQKKGASLENNLKLVIQSALGC